MVLALGFLGPWGLLHLLPPFKSQHVPTRFTYPAFFLLSVVAAQALEEKALTWRERFGPRVTALALWTAMGLSAVLIARENMKSTLPWFSLSVPDVPESTGPFVQYADIPAEYNYGDGNSESPRGTNSVPGLLAHRANVGTIRCSTFPGLNQDAPRALDGRPIHLGARGLGDPLYAGAAWVEPRGQVDVVRWTPSEVTLDVHGAQPGDLVALDENWDQGWTANGLPAVDHQDVVATHLDAEDEIVVFRYRPRTLPASFAALAFGLALVPSAWFLRQKGNQLRSTKSA